MPMRLAAAVWRATVPLPVRHAVARARSRLTEPPGTRYYSAAGEDAVMMAWIGRNAIAPSTIRYLDIGACHPVELSNTYMFYRLGARGVLVEPNPERAQALQAARPNDTVLNAGVAFDDRRTAKLFRFPNPVFNTFSEEQAEQVAASSRQWAGSQPQHILDTISVPLVPINEIITQHFSVPPHVISIDTEGYDLDIVKTLNFDLLSQDPKVPCLICVEGDVVNQRRLLEPKGFELIAQLPTNWIFMRHGTS
jgi:FkbM family methyltransferase